MNTYTRYDSDLTDSLCAFLDRVSFSDFYQAMQGRVIGQPELVHVCANVYHYLDCLANGRPVHGNMLLAAPSGSGKTETYRALHAYFEKELPMIPVAIFDVTQLSPVGFRGANKDEMLSQLFLASQAGQTRHPAMIYFLDELDKKLSPSYDGNGKNVNADVQGDLLTVLEGGNVTANRGPTVCTDRVLFVGLGSFDAFRTKREEKERTTGFLSDPEDDKRDVFEPLEREHMLEVGASHELLGRFPYIINYGKLTRDAVRSVIVKNVRALSANYYCSIEVSPSFVERLMESANGAYGCRTIENELQQSALLAYEKYLLSGGEEKGGVWKMYLSSPTEASITYTKGELNEQPVEMH